MGRIRSALLPCLALALLIPAAAAQARSVQPRIVGGSGTPIEAYPWQAAVVVSSAKASGDAYVRQFCGGSLITPSIVLTAAHCLYDDDPDCEATGGPEVCTPADPGGDGTKRIDPDDVDVVLGAARLSTAALEDEHPVQDVSYQASFNPETFQNDIGYLVLSAPVELTPAVQTIDLAGDDEAAVWAPDMPVEVSGWGSTFEGGPTVDDLRAATVPIVADSSCGSALVYGDEFDPATMVCAGWLGAGGVDTCSGDSGGPLEAPLEGGGYRLVGITSWGSGCAEPAAPGVYTRIAQAAPGGLRDDVVAKVAELETAYTLAPEEIVGSGGQPPVKEPHEPPPPPEVSEPMPPATTPQPVTPAPRARDPFAKCRKLKSKKKRKRCTRKVKRSRKLR
ncbi:MAG TPA: serine protease [Solirubrobacterales bacterium]|jgi:secreted trypsin-like serine protease